MRHLDKFESRRRWTELRDLVNAWDPIGAIAAGSPRDEYEDLVGPIMRLLEQSASECDLVARIKGEADLRYGTTFNGIELFARQVCEWYDRYWSETTV